MKKYVVAYTTFFDNVIHQEIVEAESPTEACIKSRFGLDWAFENASSIEEAQLIAFQGDVEFSVIEVT